MENPEGNILCDEIEGDNASESIEMKIDPSLNEAELEERYRPEATFAFKVENASMIKETQLSPACFVRGLPWKIMIIPSFVRDQHQVRSLGFFLQCNAECDSTNWSCNAAAELRLKSFKPGQDPYSRKIKHLFNSKENDWGFTHFLEWNNISDPEKGFINNDTLIFEVYVTAEAPHGALWDSKKHAGYVGLKNQGATCYMNSLLQTLFFTNALRCAVYKMPTEFDDSNRSVALALQHVFYQLQFCNKPVGTKRLTKSFGWDTTESFMQHDVQEFLRVLLDKLECKMKGTSMEGTIPELFEGKMMSYIKCKNIDVTSERTETFYDIQLSIKGKKNIYESFRDYIATETLDGDNKYDAGEHGFQDAEKGVIFVKFPPVLHLHLMRFQFDPITDCSVKFNDRFEFDEEIYLDPYLAKNEATGAVYKLHAVLVHSGDNHNGHYVVYINPLADGKWCKFDDDVVSCCTKAEAIEQNFGGTADEAVFNDKQNSNAYMLVYIRVSELKRVLKKITESEIPSELIERLKEERRIENRKRTEGAEQNNSFTLQVLLEDSFERHSGAGYFDPENPYYKFFKLKQTDLVSDMIQLLKDTFKVPIAKFRIWPLINTSQLTRLTYFDYNQEKDTALLNVIEANSTWTFFLEIARVDSLETFSKFNPKRDVAIFMKFYDAGQNCLNYIGFFEFPVETVLSDIIDEVKLELGLSTDTEMNVFEERGSHGIKKLGNKHENLDKIFNNPSRDIQGHILIFEKKNPDNVVGARNCTGYFLDLLYKVDVTFVDKNNPNESGFVLGLSQRNTYDQMANAVGKRINTDPFKIQFFKCQSYKDLPGAALSCTYDGNLRDILSYNTARSIKKIFYQKLKINVNDLENKIQFKCYSLSPDFRQQKEIVVYVDKNGTVSNLLQEATKQINWGDNKRVRKLRLVQITGHKLVPGPTEDTLVERLESSQTSGQLNNVAYRIEEIPEEELTLNDNEMLIPVSHFWKDICNSFGVPFYIKAREGELYSSLQGRIQKKLNIPQKDWEKYNFVVIKSSQAEFVGSENIINLSDFKPNDSDSNVSIPYLGLEHIDKTQRRSHSNLEKSIKIYN